MKKILALAIFLMAFTSASAAINSPNVFGASLTEGSVIFQGKNAPDFGDYSASYTQLAFDALIGFNSRIGRPPYRTWPDAERRNIYQR